MDSSSSDDDDEEQGHWRSHDDDDDEEDEEQEREVKVKAKGSGLRKLGRLFGSSSTKAQRRDDANTGGGGRRECDSDSDSSDDDNSSPKEEEDEDEDDAFVKEVRKRKEAAEKRLARAKDGMTKDGMTKPGMMEIGDRELQLYLQCDLNDGTQALKPHLEPLEVDPDFSKYPLYIQCPKTGAFYPAAKRKETTRRFSGRPSKFKKEEVDSDDRSHYLERFLNAFFMAVQGAFAGYAGAVATIAYALEKNEDLVDHYGRVSNLFRRWAFLMSSMACVGALNKFQVAHQDRRAWKAMDPLARIELRLLVVSYFVALLLTLVCSNTDVSLSTDFNDDDTLWQDTFNKNGLLALGTWRSCTWARFFVAAGGWLFSCRRFDRFVDQADKSLLELNYLRHIIQPPKDTTLPSSSSPALPSSSLAATASSSSSSKEQQK